MDSISLGLDSSRIAGPFLYFKSQEKGEQEAYWNVDALVVADESVGENLILNCDSVVSQKPEVIHTQPVAKELNKNTGFYIFHIKALQDKEDSFVNYELFCDKKSVVKNSIAVPGVKKTLRFITTSCNGFHNPENEQLIGSPENVWSEIKKRHAKNPLHLMIGLGDQVYCDQVFKLGSLVPWLDLKNNIPSFTTYKPSNQQNDDIDSFFYQHYLESYTKGSFYNSCLLSVPMMNIWDDHDFFDGYGSHPDILQNSPMIQAIGDAARKYYLLFQHGVSPKLAFDKENAIKHGFLSHRNYTFIKTIGDVTFFGLDSRGERTIHNILPIESWNTISEKLSHIPNDTNHFIMLSASPVLYPNCKKLVNFLGFFVDPYRSNNSVIQRTRQWVGTKFGLLGVLGEFSMKDNLIDHWNLHKVEKTRLLSLLDNIANTSKARVSILTGDSHFAGLSCFEDRNSKSNAFQKNRIYQMMTTPVGNIPLSFSSSTFMSILEKNVETKKLNAQRQERPLKWQKDSKSYFIQRRNWLESSIKFGVHFYMQLHTEVKEEGMAPFESFDFWLLNQK